MYRSLLDRGHDEFEENKSRFIGYAAPCQSEDEALSFIEEIKKKHSDARHNCYAYIIGENMGIQRYSDDKEPQGSAGMPILDAMKKEELVNACIVVTRYFGGVLLGKAGLYRAYSRGAQVGIKAAKIVIIKYFYHLKLSYDYSLHGTLSYYINTEKIYVKKESFTDKVNIEVFIEEENYDKFIENLNDITSANYTLPMKEKVLLKTLDGKIVE
ncbi:YigZ family protein [Peptoniphilus sp. GNH]|nr:YigZ family protein [Clostridiales bacterium KA00134]UHR02615.1 YigZ family protein [Peptoniphilus sp. GNH]